MGEREGEREGEGGRREREGEREREREGEREAKHKGNTCAIDFLKISRWFLMAEVTLLLYAHYVQ